VQPKKSKINKAILALALAGDLLFGYHFSFGHLLHRAAEKVIDEVPKFQNNRSAQGGGYVEEGAEGLSPTRRGAGPRLHWPVNQRNLLSSKHCDQVVDKKYYVSCYSYKDLIPNLIAYTLYGDLVGKGNIEERGEFYPEPQIPPRYRVYPYDYSHSGYDRGHYAPDAAFDWSTESRNATYSMVNIAPQVPVVNRKLWVKAERYARYVAKKLGAVTVLNISDLNGPLRKIGRRKKITVPVGFYKVLFNEEKGFRKCFYYRNVASDPRRDRLRDHEIDCSRVYLPR
jgi:endonuclease G